MLISVVTVCFNSELTILDCLVSVQKQQGVNVEHIIIDGASTDRTLQHISDYANKCTNIRYLSEPDEGLYAAMNKGIGLANGDVIAILNSDDTYTDKNVLFNVLNFFEDNASQDILCTNIQFVSQSGRLKRLVKASWFSPSRLIYGWMPPHPGMFLRRSVYETVGCFDESFEIAADYEFCIRVFCVNGFEYSVRDFCSVNMATGGVSTRGIESTLVINKEITRACRNNGLSTSILLLWLRLPIKLILQYLVRR